MTFPNNSSPANSNGVSSASPPSVPSTPEEISESDWQDLSYLLPELDEEIIPSSLSEHTAEWISQDRLVSEAARNAGLLGSEQPLNNNFEHKFKLFLEQGLRCQDIESLQDLFIAFGEVSEKISRISQKDLDDFSLLVARLCSHPCERKSFRALLSICKLICRMEKPVFTSDGLMQFVEALLMQPYLCENREALLVFRGLEFLIEHHGLKVFTPRQTDALAEMISAYQKDPRDEDYLPILTSHIAIPGLIESFLRVEMPADRRLNLCAYWSRCDMGLSAEARQKLALCLKEIAQPVAIPMEIEFEEDQPRSTNRLERERIVDALGAFCYLAIRAPLLRFSEDEIEGIDGLLKELLRLSPSSPDINSVMDFFLRWLKTNPVDQLKPLEESIGSLLVYAVEHMIENDVLIDYGRCLRADYPREHILTLHGRAVRDSILCKRVLEALHAKLKEINSLDAPLALRIAASCSLSGILSDIPQQEDYAKIIRQRFQELARTIRGDIPECSLEELACFLFQQFPLDQSNPDEISNMICGLAMLGCNSLLPGFSMRDRERLEEMLSILVLGEDLFAADFDILLWLSNLAEQGKLTTFHAPAVWLVHMLAKLGTCMGGDHRHSSAVVSLGKLAASNRFPLLTEAGRLSLLKLIENILEDLPPHAPGNCCEVLSAIGWLYLKEILPLQTASKYSSLFIPLLLDLSNNYDRLTKEHKRKLLFFIETVSSCEISSSIARPIQVQYAALIGRIRREFHSSMIQDQLGGGLHVQSYLGKRKEPTP